MIKSNNLLDRQLIYTKTSISSINNLKLKPVQKSIAKNKNIS